MKEVYYNSKYKDISDYISYYGSDINQYKVILEQYYISETDEEKLEKQRQNKRDLRQKKLDRIFKDM